MTISSSAWRAANWKEQMTSRFCSNGTAHAVLGHLVVVPRFKDHRRKEELFLNLL